MFSEGKTVSPVVAAIVIVAMLLAVIIIGWRLISPPSKGDVPPVGEYGAPAMPGAGGYGQGNQ